MKSVLLTILTCVSLSCSIFAADQKPKEIFKLEMPQDLAKITGYTTVLLHLNAIDRLTGKTFKQLIDGNEQLTGYKENECSLSLVFTQDWFNRWSKHIYHSSLLLDHSILHETIYRVPGSSISDPCHVGEILKYGVTIYAFKKGQEYAIAPINGEYWMYVD
jgi:hypothetical protein